MGYRGTIKIADLGVDEDQELMEGYCIQFEEEFKHLQYKKWPLVKTIWKVMRADLLRPALPSM